MQNMSEENVEEMWYHPTSQSLTPQPPSQPNFHNVFRRAVKNEAQDLGLVKENEHVVISAHNQSSTRMAQEQIKWDLSVRVIHEIIQKRPGSCVRSNFINRRHHV